MIMPFLLSTAMPKMVIPFLLSTATPKMVITFLLSSLRYAKNDHTLSALFASLRMSLKGHDHFQERELRSQGKDIFYKGHDHFQERELRSQSIIGSVLFCENS